MRRNIDWQLCQIHAFGVYSPSDGMDASKALLLEQNGKAVIHSHGILAMSVSQLTKALGQFWAIRVPGDPG